MNPCTSSRVLLIYEYAHCRQPHHFLRGVLHAVGNREVESRFPQNLAPLLDVGSFHPNHDRHFDVQLARRVHHARRQRVAAQDAAENVDQHRLDVAIGKQNAEGVLHLLGVRAAAHVEKIRRDCRPRT